MRMRTGALVMAVCFTSIGCITGFTHPLGSPEEGFIESQLVGTWACQSTDDPTPSLLTIMDFDGKQYYIHAAGEPGSDPSHSRAFATRLNDVTFLNVRGLGAEADNEWSLLAYALPDSDHLDLRMVNPTPFEDVVADASMVRDRLANQLEDPEVLIDALSCTRTGARSAE